MSLEDEKVVFDVKKLKKYRHKIAKEHDDKIKEYKDSKYPEHLSILMEMKSIKSVVNFIDFILDEGDRI